MFSIFPECSQVSGVFYHSVIHGLVFFICLIHDIEVMWRKTIKHAFSKFILDKRWVFDQPERAQGPIFIKKYDKEVCPSLPTVRVKVAGSFPKSKQ